MHPVRRGLKAARLTTIALGPRAAGPAAVLTPAASAKSKAGSTSRCTAGELKTVTVGPARTPS